MNDRPTDQPNAVIQLGNHLLATKFQRKWNNAVTLVLHRAHRAWIGNWLGIINSFPSLGTYQINCKRNSRCTALWRNVRSADNGYPVDWMLVTKKRRGWKKVSNIQWKLNAFRESAWNTLQVRSWESKNWAAACSSRIILWLIQYRATHTATRASQNAW